MKIVVGISALYHDAACCILKDGKLVAAAQEERFTRIKHDASIPYNAFRFCLEQAGVSLTDIDMIAFYENPDKKAERQLLNLSNSPNRSYQLNNSGKIKKAIEKKLGYNGPITFVAHHLSHAASAFYFSGFENSAILTVDGVGEWATTAYSYGDKYGIKLLKEVIFPHSLGLMYSAITHYLGFEVNEGEYKVMGLAPYGNPVFVDLIKDVVTDEAGGEFYLNMKYFDFAQEHRMFTDELAVLLGFPPRKKNDQLGQEHKDLACSLQVVLEEILLNKVRYLYEMTQSTALCLAGGVALNCVANGRIAREGPFKQVFIQPAANDCGGSIGAAAEVYFQSTHQMPVLAQIKTVYWGPEYSNSVVKTALEATKLVYHNFAHDRTLLLQTVTEKLMNGNIIGWFQGRMEFGPRALGARSILADPRDPEMRNKVNSMIKRREGFRPFAPVVIEERAFEHFDIRHLSPFMLETCDVISELSLPAITHINNSARVQTIDEISNPLLYQLIKQFESLTNCPILLNTSFNVKNEPIVCSPYDAIMCFIISKLDGLVIGDFYINREENSIERLESIIEETYIHSNGVDYNVYTFL